MLSYLLSVGSSFIRLLSHSILYLFFLCRSGKEFSPITGFFIHAGPSEVSDLCELFLFYYILMLLLLLLILNRSFIIILPFLSILDFILFQRMVPPSVYFSWLHCQWHELSADKTGSSELLCMLWTSVHCQYQSWGIC